MAARYVSFGIFVLCIFEQNDYDLFFLVLFGKCLTTSHRQIVWSEKVTSHKWSSNKETCVYGFIKILNSYEWWVCNIVLLLWVIAFLVLF